MFAGAFAFVILLMALSPVSWLAARDAQAGEGDQVSKPAPSATGSQAAQAPEVFEDSKTNTVRFVINGKDILTIDADGIRVNGNIEYTGTTTGANATHKSASGLSDTSNNKPR